MELRSGHNICEGRQGFYFFLVPGAKTLGEQMRLDGPIKIMANGWECYRLDDPRFPITIAISSTGKDFIFHGLSVAPVNSE